VHAVADEHDTALRASGSDPAGLGDATTVHVVPFHDSARVSVKKLLLS
jgi:hypothetical protein